MRDVPTATDTALDVALFVLFYVLLPGALCVLATRC